MALNKTIINKVMEKTKHESAIREFLMNLIQFESESPGWWKARYNEFLEKACKGGDDADN